MAAFVFGPVPSRRLGFSLGVDLIPRKYCTFDCIYCQVGKTTHREVERRSFSDPDLVVRQVMERVREGGRIDFISISGSGEPTLSADIGAVIGGLKRVTTIPVAVITNGSLFFRDDVRHEVASADLVLPSLDATGEALFQTVNRPHGDLSFEGLVSGLRDFRRAYKGAVWLEIMLIKDINDSAEDAVMFREIIAGIGADRVQLNTVTRPPLGGGAGGVEADRLSAVARLIGSRCEVIAAFEGRGRPASARRWRASVMETLKRRSMSLDDIVRTTGVPRSAARAGMDRLLSEGRVSLVRVGEDWFYVAAE